MLINFNKLVLIIAITVLIGSLIFLGYFLNFKLDFIYPPIISDCPDYWDISVNDIDTPFCKNVLKINNGNINNNKCQSHAIDLFKKNGSGKYDIMCEKYKWAKECNLTWDGISSDKNICELSKIG